MLSAASASIGIMALFSLYCITPEKDALQESLANTTAQITQTAKVEESLRESE